MKTIILFNVKGGVGKTIIAYHLISMLAELGHRCLAVDLDPQANLTSLFLCDDEIAIIDDKDNGDTLLAGFKPLNKEKGEIGPVKIHEIGTNIGLIAGDLKLSFFEEEIRDVAISGIASSFYNIIQHEGLKMEAEFCVIDIGPTFGMLNKAALIASDYIIFPLVPDVRSLTGLKVMSEMLNSLKTQWRETYPANKNNLLHPKGECKPLGYIITRYITYGSQPVMSALNWMIKIPSAFHQYLLGEPHQVNENVENDSYCLALLKHYHSLIPMAMEVKKPIFLLKPADGAIGAHYQAVLRAYQDFKTLTLKILDLIHDEIEP